MSISITQSYNHGSNINIDPGETSRFSRDTCLLEHFSRKETFWELIRARIVHKIIVGQFWLFFKQTVCQAWIFEPVFYKINIGWDPISGEEWLSVAIASQFVETTWSMIQQYYSSSRCKQSLHYSDRKKHSFSCYETCNWRLLFVSNSSFPIRHFVRPLALPDILLDHSTDFGRPLDILPDILVENSFSLSHCPLIW